MAYLGHVDSELGIAVDSSKIAVMLAWPRLKTVKEIRGFQGLTVCYRKFIGETLILPRLLLIN